jgi:transcriptional regulator with XRE-family HTH domain
MGVAGEPRANVVDLHVGARIRVLRRSLGMSQNTLAKQLGLTFQQVQKYERGSNRVSASKLYEIARVFSVPPADFFDGLPSTTGETTGALPGGRPPPPARLMETRDGEMLAEFFPLLRSKDLRRAVAQLVRAMVRAG